MQFLASLQDRPRLLVLCFLVAGLSLAAWVYAPAVDSPLYLDSTKLYQIERVYQEKGADVSPGDIRFGTGAARLVSQGSFYLNIVATDGLDTRAIKLTNVAIHLLNAGLVFLLATMVLARTSLAGNRYTLAGFIALAWLLSAVNIGSVVYAVQRMNQLSTLFSLVALLVYMSIRGNVLAGSARAGKVSLATIGVIVLTLLAYASKENGVLVIVFIAVVESYLFPTVPQWLENPRNRFIAAALATIFTAVAVTWVAKSYWADPSTQTFTMAERFLTQCRILWVYIGQLIVPSSLATGLYQDGYPVSQGLFTPVSTAIGLAGLVGLVVFALALRDDRKWMPVAFGIAFFLAGHVLESTVLPLELYFEHRNYLPSFGLYLALVVAAYLLLSTLRPALAVTSAVAYMLFFVVMAHAKSVTWSEQRYAFDAALDRSYLSPRAASGRAQLYLEEGRIEPALVLLERVASERPGQALRSRLQMLYVHCMVGFPPDDRLYGGLQESTGNELPIEVSQALQNVLAAFEATGCEAIVPSRLIPALESISEELRVAGRPAWHVDYYIAGFYLLDDPVAAVSWLEERFTDGEEAAGWMLKELIEKDGEISIAPDTRRALEALTSR